MHLCSVSPSGAPGGQSLPKKESPHESCSQYVVRIIQSNGDHLSEPIHSYIYSFFKIFGGKKTHSEILDNRRAECMNLVSSLVTLPFVCA